MNFKGIFKDLLHPVNILFSVETLEISHLDISGKTFQDVHPLNILFILKTLEVFHKDISGNDTKEKQS